MKIEARKFKVRADLENYVRNKFGLTPTPKPDHTIEGTREELALLSLSDRNIFWGITCVISDTPTVDKKEVNTADRGPRTDFGINQRDKKIKN